MVAVDPVTRSLVGMARRVAASDVTVLLGGESGTGKEVFARYIHQCSSRAKGPFVAVNCAAIPDNMLEAMLFGYEKGAFTGAHKASSGKFEQAQHGTLLLDEVTEMPLGLQAKLLRVLQEREVERLGAREPVELDVRVLATTNRDLTGAVAAGEFREDLYYRLNVSLCSFHRCESAARTSCHWPSICSRRLRGRWEWRLRRSSRRRPEGCASTPGPATSASSTTSSSVRWCWVTAND